MKRLPALSERALRSWLAHPILRRFKAEAPGSYYHSALVAALAERGAEALGLDPLPARLGGLYHDLGKLERPGLFQENQRSDDPLDGAGPHQRARAILGHVHAGLAMAEDLRLPPEIAAFIAEHHGERRLELLYRQAVEAAGPGRKPDPGDFAYPGPWPQSAETAVALYADAVEAGARVRAAPGAEGIERFALEVAEELLEQGALRAAGLDLREMRRLAAAFASALAPALGGDLE